MLTNVGAISILKRVVHSVHLVGCLLAEFTLKLWGARQLTSCSLPIRCLTVAETPCDWTPRIVSRAPTACKTGSEPKPSQLRPPLGFRPRGPTEGPSQILTPFPRPSSPMANPRSYISFLSQVAPAVIPSGNTVTLSVCLMPLAASFKHSCGKPSRGIDPV